MALLTHFSLRKVSLRKGDNPMLTTGMRPWLRFQLRAKAIMFMGRLNGVSRILEKYERSLSKSTGSFFVGAFLSMAVASGAGASESSMEFQAIGKKYIGTWSSSGTYSTDYPGVGKKGDKFTSESTCRWAAGKSAILCESVAGDARKGNSMQLIYWDPAKKKLQVTIVDSGGNFDQGLGSIEAGKIVWASFGNFADGRAVEFQWETVFSNDGNTHIHTGFVKLDGVQNNFADTLKRVAK
jgi:hypothetical protein